MHKVNQVLYETQTLKEITFKRYLYNNFKTYKDCAYCLVDYSSLTELKGKNEQIRIQLKPDARLRVEGIPGFLKQHEKKLKFVPGKNPCFVYRYKKAGTVERDEENLLVLTEQLLKDMECHMQMETAEV